MVPQSPRTESELAFRVDEKLRVLVPTIPELLIQSVLLQAVHKALTTFLRPFRSRPVVSGKTVRVPLRYLENNHPFFPIFSPTLNICMPFRKFIHVFPMRKLVFITVLCPQLWS